jgi:hypothetical protein
MPGGRDGRCAGAHVESELDEPLGHRVQHPRHLAHAGGDTHDWQAYVTLGTRWCFSTSRGATELAEEPACASDAPCGCRIYAPRGQLACPWGRTRRSDLIRIVDAVAREVIAASGSGSAPLGYQADRQAEPSIKSFAFEWATVSGLACRCQHSYGNASGSWPEWPTCCDGRPRRTGQFHSGPLHRSSGWHRCADWPDGALAWICPPAAELVRRQDSLRREFSISPRYFKACSALLAIRSVDPGSWPGCDAPTGRHSQNIRSKSQLFRSSTP